MQSLSLFANRIKKFISLKLEDKILFIKVFILTAIARAVILTIPFRILRKYLGELNAESPLIASNEEYQSARKIGEVIEIVSNHTPWQSKCLVMALTAQYLLTDKQILSTLYLGVAKESVLFKKAEINGISVNENLEDKIIAHAWTRCGEFYVTGGSGKEYSIVAKFGKGGVKNS